MRRFGLLISILFFLLPLTPSTPFAARPLFTEDAGTAEKGFFEWELAFDYIRDDNRDKYYIPSAQLAYGLTQRIEIAANFAYIFWDIHEGDKEDGISDLIAYVKYRVWGEGGSYPAFTLKPLAKFATADWKRDLGSGKNDYGLTAIFSKSFTGFNLHLDALYLLIGEEGKTDVLNTGLAVEYELKKGFIAVGEVRYQNNFNSDRKDDPAYFLVGLQAEIGKAVFDAGVNVGLNNAAPDYGFTVGVTLKFK